MIRSVRLRDDCNASTVALIYVNSFGPAQTVPARQPTDNAPTTHLQAGNVEKQHRIGEVAATDGRDGTNKKMRVQQTKSIPLAFGDHFFAGNILCCPCPRPPNAANLKSSRREGQHRTEGYEGFLSFEIEFEVEHVHACRMLDCYLVPIPGASARGWDGTSLSRLHGSRRPRTSPGRASRGMEMILYPPPPPPCSVQNGRKQIGK